MSGGHVLSSPGIMLHAQQIGLALDEVSALGAFVTMAAYRENGVVAGLLRMLPRGPAAKLEAQLRRRSVSSTPGPRLATFARWEIARTAASVMRFPAPLVDWLWDVGSLRFDTHVARRFVPRSDAVHGFEYTALDSFRSARRHGIPSILHLPSLDSRSSHERVLAERREWPETATPFDAYFDAKFESRYARRRAEIEEADLVVVNSRLTAQSHIAAGADPSKVKVVPLAAPPPAYTSPRETLIDRPLRLAWAGPFSVRKGAHLLAEAWRRLGVRGNAELVVFGSVAVPERVFSDLSDVVFRGPVPRDQFMRELPAFDALVFPTLSDGFGMVVTEALSCGVPVLTTDQAGAADLLTAGRDSLIFPAGSIGALVDAMQWCLDSREMLRAMRFEALETAKRRQWTDFRREIRAIVLGAPEEGHAHENARTATVPVRVCASAS